MRFTRLIGVATYRVHLALHHCGRLEITIATIHLFSLASAQQITMPRVEQMPNMPSPYLMRNWKEVALGYDSLVFDFGRTGVTRGKETL